MSTRSTKRPSVPRHFRGVRVVDTGRQHKFRAVADVNGERLVGPLRDDAATAHQDYLALCARRDARHVQPTTLSQALARVVQLKRESGFASGPWLTAVERVAQRIASAWSPTTAVAALDADEIAWFVGELRANGFSVNTIGGKVLPVLRAAFRVAGVVWPEQGVPRLRRVTASMSYFTLEEFRDLVARIEAHPSTRGMAAAGERQRFVDLISLMAFTGARLGEIERLRVEDFDVERRTVSLTNNKALARRDLVHWPASLDAAVARLVAGAGRGVIVPRGRDWLWACFRRWKRLLDEPRLNGRALRHTFVSAVLETSRDLAVTRDAARHSSLTMTNRYVHASFEKKRAVVDELALRLAARTPGS